MKIIKILNSSLWCYQENPGNKIPINMSNLPVGRGIIKTILIIINITFFILLNLTSISNDLLLNHFLRNVCLVLRAVFVEQAILQVLLIVLRVANLCFECAVDYCGRSSQHQDRSFFD